MKTMRFFVITIILFFSFAFDNFFVHAADMGGSKEEIDQLNKEISDRKDRIKQLEDTIGSYQKIIDQKETESVSLKNQLGILSNHISQTQADVDLNEEKIAETKLEIDKLNIQISDKQKIIAKQKRIIAKMVEGIHSNDQKNYLEIMLTYKDFNDFYNELISTEKVYVDLGNSVRSLRLATEDLASRKIQVEKKKVALEDLKMQLESKKASLLSQETAKQNLLVQTRSSEARYKTLLSSLRQQYQSTESEQRVAENKLKVKLEQQDKIPDSGSVSMGWPVISHVINAYFHDSDYPFRNVFEHSGIDVKASFGTPVKAVASGYVARAKKCTLASCYSYVLIVHTGNLSTVYGHLSSLLVADDQFVNKGDVIGYSGGTPGTVGAGPFVTGPHLHFETRLNGIPVNPLNYVTP